MQSKYKIDFLTYINFILSNVFVEEFDKNSIIEIKWDKCYKDYMNNYINTFENIDISINEIDCCDMDITWSNSSLYPLFNTYTKEIFMMEKKIGTVVKGTGKDNVVTLYDFLIGAKQLKGNKKHVKVDNIEIGSHNNKIYFYLSKI